MARQEHTSPHPSNLILSYPLLRSAVGRVQRGVQPVCEYREPRSPPARTGSPQALAGDLVDIAGETVGGEDALELGAHQVAAGGIVAAPAPERLGEARGDLRVAPV